MSNCMASHLQEKGVKPIIYGYLTDFQIMSMKKTSKRACVSALVGLQVRALRVDLSAVGEEAAVNPLLVLARRTVGRVAGRRRRRRPLGASILSWRIPRGYCPTTILKVILFTSLACRCWPWHGSEMNLGTGQPGCEVMRTMALPSPLGSDTRINPAPCDTEVCAAPVDSVNDFVRS